MLSAGAPSVKSKVSKMSKKLKSKDKAGTKRSAAASKNKPRKTIDKAARGKRKCRGCRKVLAIELFPPNQVFCRQDKNALERIETLAIKQGTEAVEFYKEARSDEDQVHEMLLAYYAVCPPPRHGGRQPKGGPTFKIMHYIERVKASTQTLVDRKGIMMWKKQYLQWAMWT